MESVTGDSNYYSVDGFCPACGQASLLLRKRDGIIECLRPGPLCPDPGAATKILSDPEIHHIVRFDEHGYFNAKHPLRERIDGELLDCEIHDFVADWVHDKPRGEFINTVWRLRPAGEHNLDANWVWEQLP